MSRRRGIKGKSIDVRTPEWEPLLDLAPSHVADFMWMFSVQLTDGARVQAYKHYWTRRYVHMDGDGRTFVYVEPDRYEEVAPTWLLAEVLDEHPAAMDRFDVFHPRRPKPDESDRGRRIVFRVPEELRDRAQKRADEEELALSQLAADALREYLERPVAVRETSGDS